MQYFDDLKLSKFHAYSFPVLVVEAPLFEVYELEGSLQINEIESGMMIWRNPLAERHSIVRIVAAKSFEKTIVTVALSLEIFLREINSSLEKK